MKVIPFYLYHSWFGEKELGNVRVCMCLKFFASKSSSSQSYGFFQ